MLNLDPIDASEDPRPSKKPNVMHTHTHAGKRQKVRQLLLHTQLHLPFQRYRGLSTAGT
jgi:hypothetical protein